MPPLRDIVLNQFHHIETGEVPYTLALEEPVSAALDAHYGHTDWRKWIAPYVIGAHAVDTDMRVPISPTHVRDGYGGIWRIDQRPFHLEKPPLPEPTLQGYEFPKPEQFFRPEWKARSLDWCRQNSGRFIVGHVGWGLFERSWNLRGFENVLVDAVEEPEFFEEVLDHLTELYLAFVRYTVELPIDAILFGDDWGDQRGIIIGPERWRRFLKPRWAKIYAAVHAAGKLVAHHSCGSVAQIMGDIIEIGVDALESCQPEAAGMNPYELKAMWGDKITFWGCLGSQSTIPHGTPAEIRAEVAKLRREMGRGGGFILAPAKPLSPEVPVENAAAVLKAFVGR